MGILLNNIYGHKQELKRLLNAIKSQRLPHALLFTGPEGIGKKKVAFALAQHLLCEAHTHVLPSACGQCLSCVTVENQNNPHIMFISPKGLYIKVDTIREIGRFLSLQSLSPARVVIIDSAHQMNLSSANSFLKILEEPPNNVYFILISSSVSSLPVTIRSRTQILRFSPLSPKDTYSVLNQIKVASVEEEQENHWLVSISQGSLSELEKWREKKEETKTALQLLKQISPKQELCSLKELSLLVKDREQALFVCLCWQKIIREARIRQSAITGHVPTNLLPDVALSSKPNYPSHKHKKTSTKSKSSPVMKALGGEVLDLLTPLSPNLLDLFFQKTIQMEQDLKRHVDCTLVFDHFLVFCRNEIQKQKNTAP